MIGATTKPVLFLLFGLLVWSSAASPAPSHAYLEEPVNSLSEQLEQVSQFCPLAPLTFPCVSIRHFA